MTDHPDDGLLLELALSDLEQPGRDELLAHLAHCEPCRAEYSAIADTVDRVLAAAPLVPPPAGFSRSVLTAMGMAPETTAAATDLRHRPNLLLVALAAVLALLLGVAGGIAVMTARDEPAQVAADGPPLLTGDGVRVGTVLDTRYDGRPVLAVTLTAGTVGMRYECRLILADGSRQAAGSWVVREPSGSTWLVDRPAMPLTGLELVAGTGRTWATASL